MTDFFFFGMFREKEIPLDKPLEEFISEFNITEAYNEHSNKTTHYLIHKVSELLDLILSEKNETLEIKAILLASNPQTNLLNAMNKNGLIFTKLTKLINKLDVVPNYIIARVVPLLTGILRSDPDNCSNIVPYILSFLQYVENPGVLSLYKVAFEKGKINKSIEEMLLPLDLPSFLFESINEFIDNDEHTYACLNIANLFCNSEEIMKMFQTETNITKIVKFTEGKPNFITNEAYVLITKLLDERTKHFLVQTLKRTIEWFREISLTVTPAEISMLDFIIKMQSFKVTFIDVNENQFFEVIIRLLSQFPNNSSIMHSISRYIDECLKDKALFARVISQVLPGIIDFASYNEHNALHIACMLMLHNIKSEYEKTNEFIELKHQSLGYTYFFNYTLTEYIDLLTKPYGGKIEKNVKKTLTIDDELLIK